MMRYRKLTLAGLAALTALLTSVQAANAALTHVSACASLETTLCTRSKLPNGGSVSVAVDNSGTPSKGDVWATYYNPARLIKYDASGNQLAEVELTKSLVGAAGIPRQIAVDPSDGDVYLATDAQEPGSSENGAAEVVEFNSAGVVQSTITGSETPQGSFGYAESVAVDPATDDLYVADSGREMIDKFSSEGAFLEQFPIPTPNRFMQDIAIDGEGHIYVGLRGKEAAGAVTATTQVEEFTTAGVAVDCPAATNVVYESPPETPGSVTFGAVAVDPSNGHLLISQRSASEGNFIADYAAPCMKSPTDAFGGGGELDFRPDQIEAIAANATTDTVYLTTNANTSGPVFEQATVPDVTTGTPATPIAPAVMRVTGTVNPDGIPTTGCEFEYGATFTYGHAVPCEQPSPLEGSGPITVSAEIRGLARGIVYYYRLKATNAGGHKVGEAQTFSAVPFLAPTLAGLPATFVSQFGATLNGTITTEEAVVDYRFEYGATTAYGQVAPIPDSYTPETNEPVTVSQPVNGLQAGTTYHYRLVASSPGGTEVRGPDTTFTTLPVPAPSASTGATSEVGVGSATLSGAIDPHGWDTTYLFQYGTGAGYGQSWPTVPVDMGALEGPQPVVVTVPGLLPGTTYHYRLVAINGGGTSYGQDMTFTTGSYTVEPVGEPVAIRTLLVPSESGRVVTSNKAKKKKKVRASRRRKRKVHKARRGAKPNG